MAFANVVPTGANALSTNRIVARQSRNASSFSIGDQRMLSGTITAPAQPTARYSSR